jgi:hypothetical protein
VTIGEVHGWIEKAFEVGAGYRKFENLSFVPWYGARCEMSGASVGYPVGGHLVHCLEATRRRD